MATFTLDGIEVAIYRVTKAYGLYQAGDTFEHPVSSVVTRQSVRAGLWERMPEDAWPHTYLRGGPDDPEVAHLWAAEATIGKSSRRKKKTGGEASV